MADDVRIVGISSDITQYLRDLREIGVTARSDLDDKKTFYAVSMPLFSLLKRMIDLGEEIDVGRGLGIAVSCRDIFIILQREGIISASRNQDHSRLVYYRDLLSHEYSHISRDDVSALIGQIKRVEEFALLILRSTGDIVRYCTSQSRIAPWEVRNLCSKSPVDWQGILTGTSFPGFLQQCARMTRP